MRVVVLGEFRADRLVPPLRRAGADVVVLGFADLASFLGPDVTCGRLPDRLTEQGLETLLDDCGADVAIPNMGRLGQEQMLPVYARVGARRRAAGRKVPVHSEEFAVLASDKVAFHRTAEARHWPVPRGTICDDPGALRAAVAALGLPVLVKEARSEFHAGRHHVSAEGALDGVCREVVYPALVQQAVEGEEFAVELLTLPSRRTLIWPVASLDTLDGDCAPGRRMRVAPALLPRRAMTQLAATVRDIVAASGPEGPWQIDLAVDRDGQLRLLEVNGRFGGVSNMSWVATRCDPHVAHVAAVFGRPLPSPRPERIALELPVENGTMLPPAPPGTTLQPFTGNPANQGPYVGGYYRAVLGFGEDAAEEARAWLRRLPSGTLLGSPDAAVAQLNRGLSALKTLLNSPPADW